MILCKIDAQLNREISLGSLLTLIFILIAAVLLSHSQEFSWLTGA